MLRNSVFPFSGCGRRISTAFNLKSYKTAVVLLNMGGPQTVSDVNSFLLRLFSDREIFKLPFQKVLSQFVAKRRSPKIIKQYHHIGGGSPITRWTELQGQRMVELLDYLSPTTAPHKFYIAFRYVHPLTESTINQIEADGVSRAVAFMQYPQYSCTTSGSSLNALVRHYTGSSRSFTGVETIDQPQLKAGIPGPVWSFIDRWPVAPHFVKAMAQHIREELMKFTSPSQRDVVILFSAHSIPMSVVNRGDSYPQEVGATVHAVMQELNFCAPYRLVWQSKVGPVSWLGPTTQDTLHGLARLGYHHALLVPVAFTSDHIETLYEMDVEYCTIEAEKAGMKTVRRTAALNDNDVFIKGSAQLLADHLRSGEVCSRQLLLRCPQCTNSSCYHSRQFILAQQERLTKWTSEQFT